MRHNLRSLGGCPRLAIFSQIEAYGKNYHRHIFDIGVCAYLREGILGQSPGPESNQTPPDDFQDTALDKLGHWALDDIVAL